MESAYISWIWNLDKDFEVWFSREKVIKQMAKKLLQNKISADSKDVLNY